MSERDVFINCPFTADYQDHVRAIVFTVLRSGFQPRCARGADDAGEIRFDKICRIIRDSPYGIHDISKTEYSAGEFRRANRTDWKSLNMPWTGEARRQLARSSIASRWRRSNARRPPEC